MTRTRQVLVVGDVGSEIADAIGSIDRVEVDRGGDADEGLYRLATTDVDCVVASQGVLDGETTLSATLEDLPDIPVVTIAPTDETVESREDGSSAVPSDVVASVRDALGLSDDETDADREPDPVGPLALIVSNGTIVETDGPPMAPLGYDPDSLVDETLADYVHPADLDDLAALLDDDSEGDSAVLRLEHYDGDPREVWLERRPAAKGRTRLEVFRRKVEELPAWFPRGEAAEEMLAAIFLHVPIHLFVKDEEGRHVWVSRFHTGNTEETIGKRDVDFDWGDLGEEAYADDMDVIETGEPVLNREEYVPMQDDWNLTSKVPWIDRDGDIRGLVGVTQRITKRKEYQERLERENERLERFASIVSHDLRNPINVAMGNLELARNEDDPAYLDRIERALTRMDHITADVLTMAREGEWVSDTEPVSLSTIAHRGWDMVATGEAAIDVQGDLEFLGDPDRLHHLFENLYRNAVEHGGESVTVCVGPLDGSGFFVEDDGVGIPPAEIEHLFETGQSARSEETGLGLEIVRQVADAHGWEVSVEEGTDGGARFEFTGLSLTE